VHDRADRPVLGLAGEADGAERSVTEVDAHREVQVIGCSAPADQQLGHPFAHGERQPHGLAAGSSWQRVIEQHGQTVLDERADRALEA